jgi:UDP-2,4-diacetamido-2,4,6-trideoxy-beta-L-altropyranose hydrolase
MLRVAFRADASKQIGTGHLRRCLSLAKALCVLGVEAEFVSRAIDDTAPALLEHTKFSRHWLRKSISEDATESAQLLQKARPDWVVTDHYGLTDNWHDQIRQEFSCKLAVIDDLANRPLSPDLLIDPNDPSAAQTYAVRLRRPSRILGGPRFALLDPSYAEGPRYVFSEAVRSIGIFMGGTDPINACEAALLACRRGVGFEGLVEVVCSPLAPHYASLGRACSEWPDTHLIHGLPDLACFFARHDVQVGAGGGAAWERCCVGVPTVVCLVADNQRATVPRLDALGAVLWAREEDGGLEASLAAQTQILIGSPERRRQMSKTASLLVDGRGAARVAAVMGCMAGAALRARPAGVQDEGLLLEWVNDPMVRANAFDPRPIAADGHRRWLADRLADVQRCRIFIVEAENGVPVGQVRFDRTKDAWEIGYSIDSIFRGCGLGGRVLCTAIHALQAGGDWLAGRVKRDNEPSMRVFQALGFGCEEIVDARGAHWLFRRRADEWGK